MERNFVKGSARLKTFDNGWEVMNVSLNLEDLQRLPQVKWYVKICIAKKKEKDQYGNTHMIYEDTYVPVKKEGEEKSELPR